MRKLPLRQNQWPSRPPLRSPHLLLRLHRPPSPLLRLHLLQSQLRLLRLQRPLLLQRLLPPRPSLDSDLEKD